MLRQPPHGPRRHRVHRFPKTTVAGYYLLAIAGLIVLTHLFHPRAAGLNGDERQTIAVFLLGGLACLMPRLMSPLLAKALDLAAAWFDRRREPPAPPADLP